MAVEKNSDAYFGAEGMRCFDWHMRSGIAVHRARELLIQGLCSVQRGACSEALEGLGLGLVDVLGL